MSNDAALRVTEARKTWRRGRVEALRGVSFDVPWGSVIGLVGPNGAGKSTLLGAMMGFVRLDEGHITVGAHDAGTLSARRVMTWLPQAFPVERGLSGRAMLEWLHELGGGAASAREQEVSEILEAVGLDDRAARRRLTDYSGGMRQRLGIAQAFMGAPRVVVLDEPTAGLDPIGVRQLRTLMRATADRGGSVLMSSHQLDEVARACDQVLFLRRGLLLEESPTSADELEQLFFEEEVRPS